MQISLAQEIAESEEVENAEVPRQLMPSNVAVQLSKRPIKDLPEHRLRPPRLIWVLVFPPPDEKADQSGHGKKEEATLRTAFF
jgi:hypothetical protein